MALTKESPVEQFPGSVQFSEPMNMSQVVAFEEALRQHNLMVDPTLPNEDQQTRGARHRVLLRGLFECVEEWNLSGKYWPEEGVTLETFPGTPRAASAELIVWLLNTITAIYTGEEVPE